MIRIGIVGCGRILAAHLRGYRLLRAAGIDDFRITALCARREADARMYVERGTCPQRAAVSHLAGDPLAIGDEYLSDFQDDVEVALYTDYRQMIAEAPLDAVNDFTTHALHHQVAEVAFAHGKHLLTQKPLAVTVAAARQMCDAARKHGCVLGVFENFRHAPATRRLRWLFGPVGPAGPVQMVLLTYAGMWWAPDHIVAETPWRHRLIEGGGISLDLGVHFFDQIRHVAGEIESVQAQTAIIEPTRTTRDAHNRVVDRVTCDADDTFTASFRTEQGALGHMCASWAGHGGAATLGPGTIYYGARGQAPGDQVRLDDGTQGSLADLHTAAVAAEEQRLLFPHGLDDSFALSQLDWLAAIRQQRDPETSGEEGLRDLAAAYAILESAQAGRRIAVADVAGGVVREYQRPIDEHFGIRD